jgi:hypothetical protein
MLHDCFVTVNDRLICEAKRERQKRIEAETQVDLSSALRSGYPFGWVSQSVTFNQTVEFLGQVLGVIAAAF